MRKPKISQKVIGGIINSAQEHLAGDVEDIFGSKVIAERIIRANAWANEMREWMRYKGTWKETIE